MALKLNKRGETYAQARINRGKIDYDSEWAFSDDERNAMFAESIERFAEWHLGRDTDGDEDKASTYQFPAGKDGKVHRSALEATIKEARKLKKKEPGAADIEASAKDLLDRIDRKKANSRRLMFFGERPGMEAESDPRKRFEGVILLDTSIVLGDHPDMVEGGGREGWTQIALTGKFLGHWQGPFEVTEDDLAVMVENFNRFVNPVLFDYGHESVWDSAALASGWGHEFEIGKKGQALYSNVEWTDAATERIRAGELKYISPVIMFQTIDPYTGEDLGPSIWTVGLLNTPFLDGMDPVEIGGQIAATRKALNGAPLKRQWAPRQAEIPLSNQPPADAGTAASTTPEPVPAQPDPEPVDVQTSTSQEGDGEMDKATICKKLGIPENTPDEVVLQKMEEHAQAAGLAGTDARALADAQAAQSKAEDEAKVAQAKADDLEKERKERELQDAQGLVEAYIKANRIAPASREQAVQLALGDRASFDTLYGTPDKPGAAVVPMGAVAPGEPAHQMAGDGGTPLSDGEMDVIAKMRPRLERLAQKQSKRLGREVTVEEVIANEKKRRAATEHPIGKVEKHPPTANTTRVG